MDNVKPHFLFITYPAQGHINPGLQFAKKLLKFGADVTFLTNIACYKRINNANVPKGLVFATFSDGYDDGFSAIDGNIMDYFSALRKCGTNTLEALLEKSAFEGKQVTYIVCTILLPWVPEVARKFHVPSALIWIQPATVFDIYYYYFNGYSDAIDKCEDDPSWSLELPNLSTKFKACDLPSFFQPSSRSIQTFALPIFKEQIEDLKTEEKPKILVNTFEALEVDALKSIERLNLISIGPLLPSTFLNGKDSSDKSFGADLFQKCKDIDYMKWLNSRGERSSVIYVSFGSMAMISKPQMEQLGIALIQTHKPFLWVIRDFGNKEKDSPDELSCMEELKQQGLMVPWCCQVEVLSHPSIGCFMTHCGWNSTLESLTSGVPMVAFPQWSDQSTNAKLVEDVWKTGVRVKVSEEGGLVKSGEIKRCLEKVLESEEMKENAKKWRQLALEAAQEGGTSDNNLNAFMKEVFNDCRKNIP